MGGSQTPRERLALVHQELMRALDAKDAEVVERAFLEIEQSPYRTPLSSDTLIAVAASMLGANKQGLAMRAYREHLRAYPNSSRNPEINFRLGILFSRRFHDYDEALTYLRQAVAHHSRGDRVARAELEIRRIEANLDRVDVPSGLAQGVSGLAWVVRQTDDPINLPQVGRIVAKEAGRPLAEVTGELRRSRGILLTGAPIDTARRVARRLQETGVPVLVIPEDDLISVPPASAVSHGAISPEGMRFESGQGVVERSWSDVFFVVAGRLKTGEPGRIRSTLGQATFGHGAYGGGGRTSRQFHFQRSTEREFIVLDFFVFGPWQRLRVQQGATRLTIFAADGAQAEARQIERFTGSLLEYGPQLAVNEFVHRVAAGDYHRVARRFTFDNFQAFDAYCQWLLQLEEHSRPQE